MCKYCEEQSDGFCEMLISEPGDNDFGVYIFGDEHVVNLYGVQKTQIELCPKCGRKLKHGI